MSNGLHQSFSVFSSLGVAVLTMSLAACGGGSGGGSGSIPADPDATFKTEDPGLDQVGESKGFTLSGTATAYGNKESVTGSITASHKPNGILNGQQVSVTDLIFVVHFPSTGTTISAGQTSYATFNGDFIQTVGDDGVTCLPDANYKALPATVKLGDAGVIGGATCSDGTILSSSYLVEVSDRNNAWAAITEYATYSEPGLDDIFEDIVYHVSTDGQVRAIDISASDGNVSFTLGS